MDNNYDYFYVYIITNLLNGKWYVGKTYDIPSRWVNHKSGARRGVDTYLYRAIRKYGEQNFIVEQLGKVSSEEEALNLEKIWIILLESHKEEFGYNLTLGGEGVVPNEVTRAKIGRPVGSHHTEETKARISLSSLGRKKSPESVAKGIDSRKGLKFSEETRKKQSDKKKGLYAGEKHPMYGKHHTKETKEKIRNKLSGIPSWNLGVPCREETKKKLSDINTERMKDPSARKSNSEASKRLWEDPEYRAKMKIAQDARYAREAEQRQK